MMKKTKKLEWRVLLHHDGKVRPIKLLGGVGKDEVIAFKVELAEGDTFRVDHGLQSLGAAALIGNMESFESDDHGAIEAKKAGVYDIHVDTSHIGKEQIYLEPYNEKSEEDRQTQKHNLSKMERAKAREVTLTILHNLFICLLAFIWLVPIFWLLIVSMTKDARPDALYSFFPAWEEVGFDNYINVLTKTGINNQFPRWFLNTLIVSVASTILSALLVLVTAFSFSRFRFKKRKGLMNLSMIVALFPGMLTMFVSYELFQYVFHLDSPLIRLIIAYSAGAGLGYLVAKGFFDTIPMEVDEAARIDGASKARIFFQILVPLSKPIIVYTIITAFMSPWVDFVFANIIEGNGASVEQYTVAMGLIKMIEGSLVYTNFGMYIAGSVIVAIPLSVLFIIFQRYYVGGVTGGAVKG